MKTHASHLVMNQAMLYEFPQGDPYSGPAYGDKHKSKGLGMVLGVVASVATMGAAVPMLASGVMASQIAGGAMMAGGVLSGVGAVTENKKLMKVGGVLSLAGGIGNFAAGAMGAGQAGSTGMLAAGSGSQALSSVATNFMESVNSLGVGELYSAETIAAGKAASGGATAAGGVAETAANEAGSRTLQLAGESTGAPGATGQTIDIAEAEIAASGAGGSGAIDPMSLDTSAQMGRSRVVDVSQYTPTVEEVGKEASTLDKALEFARKNPEVTKIGAGMLEKAMASGAEDEKIQAMSDYYKNQGALTLTQNELARYKLANAGKQVAMISADDKDLDAKVKQATAAGIPVAFIPTIGQNYTPYSNNFTPVVRNATYNQPTA